MSIEELYQKYMADSERMNNDYRLYSESKSALHKIPAGAYQLFKIDNSYYLTELAKAIQTEFHLTDKQTAYVMSAANERYQSYYSEIFHGAKRLAELLTNFPKD